MRLTTTKLRLTILDRWRMHETAIRTIGWAGIFATTLLLISSLLKPPAAPPQQALTNDRGPGAIVIMTTTAHLPWPTYTPFPTWTPQPTSEPIVIVEQAPPIVQVVEVYVEVPAQAVATPEPAPAVYDVLSERQQDIQNRLVEPIYPTIAPMEMNEVNAEWARQQWAAEHCVGGVCH